MADIEFRISEGSGWQGANWLLSIARPEKAPEGSTANLAKLAVRWISVGSFKNRIDAMKYRDELLRAFILQAASLTSSERG